MQNLVKIDSHILEGMAAHNVASPDTFTPFMPDFKKSTIEAEALQIVQQVNDGNMSALQAMLMAKALVKMADIINSNIVDNAINEVELYPKGKGDAYGAKFEIMNTPTTYDYDSDSEYQRLNNDAKKRRDLLATALKTDGVIFDQDGAEVPRVPIKSNGGTTVKVTFL